MKLGPGTLTLIILFFNCYTFRCFGTRCLPNLTVSTARTRPGSRATKPTTGARIAATRAVAPSAVSLPRSVGVSTSPSSPSVTSGKNKLTSTQKCYISLQVDMFSIMFKINQFSIPSINQSIYLRIFTENNLKVPNCQWNKLVLQNFSKKINFHETNF